MSDQETMAGKGYRFTVFLPDKVAGPFGGPQEPLFSKKESQAKEIVSIEGGYYLPFRIDSDGYTVWDVSKYVEFTGYPSDDIGSLDEGDMGDFLHGELQSDQVIEANGVQYTGSDAQDYAGPAVPPSTRRKNSSHYAIDSIIDRDEMWPIYQELEDGDKATAELFRNVYERLGDELEMPPNVERALKRFQNLLSRGTGGNLANARNQIFKAANELKMELPHYHFNPSKLGDEVTAQDFAPGEAVQVHAFGNWYHGTVVSIGRSKVKVNYTSGTGANRDKSVGMDKIRKSG